MRRLMSQTGEGISAMKSAGGDAEDAADRVIGHSTRNVFVRNGKNRFHGGVSGDITVTLSGRSGISGYDNLILAAGTGKMKSDRVDAAVHELAHAAEALQGFAPSRAIESSMPFGAVFGYYDNGDVIGWQEGYAVHIENIVRSHRGHALKRCMVTQVQGLKVIH